MPMGAVIFADFWLLPRLGLKSDFAAETGVSLNWAAALSWLVTLALVMLFPLEIFFKGLPGWFIVVILYILLSFIQQKRTNSARIPLEA